MGRQIPRGHRKLAAQLGAAITVLPIYGPIRKIIYTTNAVEGFHRQVRKVTKTKGAFTYDMALLKPVYPAQRTSKRNGPALCTIGA